MKKIIQVEWAKLKKFHTLKILFGAYMVVVPCWMLFMNWFFKLNPQIAKIFTQKNLFGFPDIWSFNTYCASFFNILLAVIIVIITCNEIQYKTMRQNLIEGQTKQQVIIGKFLIVIALSLLATLFTFLTGLIIGLSSSGSEHFMENIHLNVLYFVQTLGYFTFAFLFALIVKRPALAIITFIVYFPVETIVGNLISHNVYQFFPLKVYADLTPIPFFQQLLNASKDGAPWVLDMDYKIILSCFYIIACFFLTYWIIKRRDL